MSKLLILILCLSTVYCASVHKREIEENSEYTYGNEEDRNRGEGNEEVNGQKSDINIESQEREENNSRKEKNEDGKDSENKGKENSESGNMNYEKNNQVQPQNLYYLVPLGMEFLYPVNTYNVPIVYYVK